MTKKTIKIRMLSLLLVVVMVCTCINWHPIRHVSAQDTLIVLEQTPGEAGRSGGDGLSRWSNDAWGFRLKNDYITHTFDVPVSGKYQLLHKGAVEGTGTFDVTVDRIPSGSITLTGTDGNAEIETDAGAYYFEAGKHTVTFTYAIDTENYSTVYLKTILKQIDSTTVVALQDHEKDEVTTTSPNGYSDFSADNEGGYIGFWDTQTVTFQNIAIPQAGVYGVYVDCGSDSDTNAWKATLNEKTLSDTAPNTGSCIAFERQKLGRIELEEGNVTLHLEANITSGVLSMIRVLFVWECSEEPVKLLETSEEANYQAYTLEDFNIPDGSLSCVGNQTVDHGNTLDKTLFRAKLYFPQEPFGNLIWGGNDWNGLNITMDRFGTGIYITVISNTVNVIQEFWIAPDAEGVALIGNENLDIAISTEFLDKDEMAGTAKLKLGIWLNGALYANEYFTSDTIAMADFTRHLHGQGITESLRGASIGKIYEPEAQKFLETSEEINYQTYTLADFNIPDGSLSYVGNQTVDYGATLDKTLFRAKLYFPQEPFGNLIWGGNDWNGLNITMDRNGTGIYITVISNTANVIQEFWVAPDVAGIPLIGNENLEFAISTVFLDKDDVAGTAKLKLGIWLNGALYANKYFTSDTIAMADFTRHLHGQTLAEGLLGASILKENIADEKEQLELSSVYTQMTARDYRWERITVNSNMFYRIHSSETLDGTSFGAKVTFSEGNVGTTAFYIGGDRWEGIRIEAEGNGNLGVSYNDSEGKQTWIAHIKPEEVNMKSFLGVEFELLLTFDFHQKASGELDCILGIYINENMYQDDYFIVNNVEEKSLTRTLFVYSEGHGAVTIESIYKKVNFKIWGLDEDWKQTLEIF